MARWFPTNFLEYIAGGNVWRIGIGYTAVSNGAYTGIGFTTPATGQCLCALSDIQKTGGEVMVSALEGATLGGTPSALTPHNYNRIIGDSGTPFTSPAQTDTVTGGSIIGEALMGGTAVGATKLGGAASGTLFFALKPSTTYFWKMEAEQANVTLEAHLDVLYLTASL